MRRCSLALYAAVVLAVPSIALPCVLPAQAALAVTHGPMLGRLTASQVAVWVRTSAPGTFRVRYGTSPTALSTLSAAGTTVLANDNTGSVLIPGLTPNTTYYYQVVPSGAEMMAVRPDGSFLTLPDAESVRNAEHNPNGLFNFRFEFGTGNNQNPGGTGPWPPAFKTMLDKLQGKVHFAIQNGDFIYEEKRDLPEADWRAQVGLTGTAKSPRVVALAPSIVGVWENYKLYMKRGEALAAWHRNMPGFFTFDDHEIIDNIEGTSTVGRRDRKAVFRDIGSQAWYDYLGWANPVAPGEIRIGMAQLKAGSDILTDAEADFVGKPVDLNEAGALHVHWGGSTAGLPEKEVLNQADKAGEPNAGVYEIVERIDARRLRIRPAATRTGTAAYSLGRRSYYEQRVGNAHFFYLDTRSYRSVGDVTNPGRTDLTMLGARQKAWLKDAMRKSDADMFFVVSQVTLMIPHVGGTPTGGGAAGPAQMVVEHDEAWPVFQAEREELITFWDSLGKSVMVLTGDLHNSFSVKVTDRVWEFASGPHNSRNHRADAEGDPPPNGSFTYGGRTADIRWSSYFLSDVPAPLVRQPIYTTVQINNVFNNPKEPGKNRWVTYPHPQVIFQFFDALTGDLLYAETIRVK